MDSEVVESAEISALIVHSCSHAVAAWPRWVFLGALSDLRDSTPTVLSITFINFSFLMCVLVRPEPRAAADARHPSKNAECGIRDGEWGCTDGG